MIHVKQASRLMTNSSTVSKLNPRPSRQIFRATIHVGMVPEVVHASAS